MIASLIENEDISILKTGEPIHFHIQTGTFSRIDLYLCSSNCYLDFTWQVIEDGHTSDHLPIIIGVDDSIPGPRSPRWCLEKADWTRFKDLTAIDTEAKDLPTIDDAINLVCHIVFHAVSLVVPRTTGKFHRRQVSWWNMIAKYHTEL